MTSRETSLRAPDSAPAADEHVHGASFRDPSGFVFLRDGVVHRQVNKSFADEYDALQGSGLYERLVGDGLLIPHEEVDLGLAAAPDDAYRVLRPEPVPFISYPYEWCPAQLRDAALATLRIQDHALDVGMTLKDASAYNIQFHEGRPVFIDSLSFEPLEPGEPWIAYGQFCSHFLAPLALQAKVDVRLSTLQRSHIDGVPLDLASELLPFRTRLRPGLLTHLHLHSRMQRRYEDAGDPGPGEKGDSGGGGFSERAFRGLVDSLRGAVTNLTWDPGGTTWSDYYDEAEHYSDAAMGAKQELVATYLDHLEPGTVWDLGANTGRFSRLATERGAFTVAFDSDPGAIEQAWRNRGEAGDRQTRLLPLVMDLANPSPDQGWAHAERQSLRERGPADTALALALVHHLAMGGNVPLDRIADFLASIARSAIVEFVPPDDPKAKRLMTRREDVFTDYRQDVFEEAVAERFTIARRDPVGDTQRTLYLLETPDT